MRKRLLFVSPRFLFPADEGGKIRTGQVLRGMKGGRFELTLCSPCPEGGEKYGADIERVCDHFVSWPVPTRSRLFPITRMRHLFSALPIPVRTDRDPVAAKVVADELARQPDLVVFDFVHSAVLMPDPLSTPSVLFTHNVEGEIFKRHTQVADNAVKRAIWRNQHRKMEAFERAALRRVDRVVAVSERDARSFRDDYELDNVDVIPTGVDLDYFRYAAPGDDGRVVFTGALDWAANLDGIGFLLDEVWGKVQAACPRAHMQVIGRNPPAHLVERAQKRGFRFTFSGFVDDIRDHVPGSTAYVIPLRVGGGTRIKGYEALAMGCPVASTAIGVEGLSLRAGEHYLEANTASEMAAALIELIQDRDVRDRLSKTARSYVEDRFSFERAARTFEDICAKALGDVPCPQL